jgi:putative oxidoreductase
MDQTSTTLRGLRLLCQVALGVLLLYAGGQKLFVSGVAQFVGDVEKFQILPAALVPIVAYVMPWWEVVTGLCLMLDVMRKGALCSALIMTLSFCWVIGWAWYHGLDISCGCFGKSDATIQYPRKSVELLLQLAAVIFAASGPVLAWREISPSSTATEQKNS